MDRRSFVSSAVAGFFGAALASPRAALAQAAPAQAAFDFDAVVARAHDMAQMPYRRPLMKLTEPFADLKYDAFRAIRFREDKRLFNDGRPFQVDLLPPGFSFQDAIEIYTVEGGVPKRVPFSVDYFDFSPDFFPYKDGKAPSNLGKDLSFSGVRIRNPLNRPGVWDEFAVFQGASYFRAVAHDTIYGLSARGLAIGAGGPDPEEFPIFTAFWLVEPQPGDRALRMSALLDSDSVAGAFDFSLAPGVETVIQVRSVIFPRRDIATIGIAPLTSMYYFGPDRRGNVDDFRNAVHDSDGLRIVNGSGERLWRPLRNPTKVETSAFADENPQSFGLIQRARSFGDFEDGEAHYELRPSAWVEPGSGWGRGSVMLVELPSADEYTDNIVVFWRPEAPLLQGSRNEFDYRITWGVGEIEELPLARIVSTRSGLSILDARERVFVVDFDLGMVEFPSVVARLQASTGEIRSVNVTRLPEGNQARVAFHFVAGDQPSAEFRLWLDSENTRASEIWLYRWSA
jgi:glucans biosynthesis protein